MKVVNMKSAKGRAIPNQFIVFDSEYTLFQSHNSTIVKITFENGVRKVLLDLGWACSKTTSKYRNMFLGETTRETAKKLADGVYEMVDLNNEVIE